jgi:hypothetical protein
MPDPAPATNLSTSGNTSNPGPKTIGELVPAAVAKADAAEAAAVKQAAAVHPIDGTPGGEGNGTASAPAPSSPPAPEASGQPTGEGADAASPPAAAPPPEATKQAELLKQIGDLAAKAGLVMDAGTVTSGEKAAMRRWRQGEKAKLTKREEAVKALETDAAQFAAAKKAMGAGDPLGTIEALGIDPSKLNEALAGRLDPSYAAAQQTKAELAKVQAEREQEKKQQQQAAANHDMNQRRATHFREIAQEWGKSEDPVLQRMAKHPTMVEAARAHAERAERKTGNAITNAEATAYAREQLRAAYAQTHSVFGGEAPPEPTPNPDSRYRDAPNPEAADQGAETPETPAPQPRAPKAVAHRKAAEVGKPTNRAPTKEEWRKRWEKPMRDSSPK